MPDVNRVSVSLVLTLALTVFFPLFVLSLLTQANQLNDQDQIFLFHTDLVRETNNLINVFRKPE